MKQVFDNTKIKNINLKNRIFRSATHEGLGDDQGFAKPELLDLFIKLAKGGAGAIITGYVGTQPNGKAAKSMRMFDDDKYIDDYKKINAELAKLDTPLIAQIAHGGAQTSSAITKQDTVAPSDYKNKMFPGSARTLSENEIEEIIDNFVNAIVRSQKAGFSAVQLHCAHGYLLYQFLSPYVNKRTDKWGGSTENRFRIVSEIMQRARQKVGDYPILVKFSTYDNNKNGIRIDEGIKIAELFEKAGCDAIEVSCGGIEDGFNTMRVKKIPSEAIVNMVPPINSFPPLKKKIFKLMTKIVMKKHKPLFNYNVDAAEKIKQHVNIPVITVGGIRKLKDMEDILSNNKADYIAMCRPFIIDPAIVNKLQSGKRDESQCIECGYCMLGISTSPLKCYYGKIK